MSVRLYDRFAACSWIYLLFPVGKECIGSRSLVRPKEIGMKGGLIGRRCMMEVSTLDRRCPNREDRD